MICMDQAGNAWHADHVHAVYQGGGLCETDNVSSNTSILITLRYKSMCMFTVLVQTACVHLLCTPRLPLYQVASDCHSM